MGLIKAGEEDLSLIIGGLSLVVDFDKDLPSNVFIGNDFVFWFFERPLLSYLDIFSELIASSFKSSASCIYVKFSGAEVADGSCFAFDGLDIDSNVIKLNDGFLDFFDGKVGYPILFFNETYDWVALESSREEFGVLAARVGRVDEEFLEYLNCNFMTVEEIFRMTSGPSDYYQKMARAFYNSYGGKHAG